MTRSRISVVVLLTSLVASVLLLVSPAQALAARTLSIAASPVAALGSTNVTFSGKVSKTPAGSNVKIQRKVGTKWVTVKTVKTKGSGGAYAATLARPAKAGYYVYRAFAPKFEGLKAALSKAVTVASLRKTAFVKVGGFDVLYQGDAVAGDATKAIGSLARTFTAGAPATLQRKVGTVWTKVGASTVAANGVFQIDFTAKTGVYRVVIGRKALNASATSVARTVTFSQA